jgi:hypothetical protein
VALQVLFFALPVLGLTVLVGSVVEVAEVLRGRRQNDRMWSAAMAESMSNHVILVGWAASAGAPTACCGGSASPWW